MPLGLRLSRADLFAAADHSGDWSETRYLYNAADRLLEVEQGWSAATGLEGGDPIQRRTLVYDGLGRLVRESLPESGTTAFTYDANGNLKTGIDDRGKKAESFYDPLDRLIRTEYDDLGESAGRVEPTPAVRLFYDGAGSTDFRYDPMGRVARTVRTTAGKTLTATYRYDASGGLTRAQYAEVNPAKYALIRTHDDQGDPWGPRYHYIFTGRPAGTEGDAYIGAVN